MDVDPNYDPSDFFLAGLPRNIKADAQIDEKQLESGFEVSTVSAPELIFKSLSI